MNEARLEFKYMGIFCEDDKGTHLNFFPYRKNQYFHTCSDVRVWCQENGYAFKRSQLYKLDYPDELAGWTKFQYDIPNDGLDEKLESEWHYRYRDSDTFIHILRKSVITVYVRENEEIIMEVARFEKDEEEEFRLFLLDYLPKQRLRMLMRT